MPPFLVSGRGKGGGVDFAVEENVMDMSKTRPFLFIPMTHDFNIAGPCTNPGIQNDNYSIPPIPNPHSRIYIKTRYFLSGLVFHRGPHLTPITPDPRGRPVHLKTHLVRPPPLHRGPCGPPADNKKNDDRKATQEHFDNKSSKLLFGPAAPNLFFSYG